LVRYIHRRSLLPPAGTPAIAVIVPVLFAVLELLGLIGRYRQGFAVDQFTGPVE
jgi:hypothetical protein